MIFRNRFRERLMRRFRHSIHASLVVLGGLICASVFVDISGAQEAPTKPPAVGEKAFSEEQIDFFEKQVHPVLKARCLKCHGGEEKIRGGLELTSRAALLKGGDQGAAVDLKNPAESLLIQAINYDGLEMPPSGKLPKAG